MGDTELKTSTYLQTELDQYTQVLSSLNTVVEDLRLTLSSITADAQTFTYASFVKILIEEKDKRLNHLSPWLFNELGWAMLLDLFDNSENRIPVSITSLCIASGGPQTTALRILGIMETDGLIMRTSDMRDGRRIFLTLSERANQMIVNYLDDIATTRKIKLTSSSIIK